MAVMTLSNHVLKATAQGDTFGEWVCLERIVWRGATNATHLIEVNDSGGKAILEPRRAGSTTADITFEMHGKWANGLDLVDLDSGDQVDFYLRQVA